MLILTFLTTETTVNWFSSMADAEDLWKDIYKIFVSR